MTKDQQMDILIARRIFPINGEIKNGIMYDMERALFSMSLEDAKRAAYLVIDSGGGNVEAALSGFDFIKSLPFPIECTVVGDCHSATLTLMAACAKRKATKHSRFLFHAMTFTPSYRSTEDMAAQMQYGLEQHSILFEQCLTLQSESYGIPREELLRMREIGERYNVRLTAQEAKEKGIIHEIVEKFSFFDPLRPE